MADFVWVEFGDVAVYFTAESPAEAWKIARDRRKRWQRGDFAGVRGHAFSNEADFAGFASRQVAVEHPNQVKRTRLGALYDRKPEHLLVRPPAWSGPERWTKTLPGGERLWLAIGEHVPGESRIARNSDGDRFIESAAQSDERRLGLARAGWTVARER